MTITPNTKIASILKENPKALDAIVSINSHFEKLRNPFLRKLMAARTTLSAASKFGNCTLEDFYKKLEPLGFTIDRQTLVNKENDKKKVPEFVCSLRKEQLVDLDVRPVIASGSDPLNIIMDKVKFLQPGEVLRIINTFEPTPLIHLLQKKGYESYVEQVDQNRIDSYFTKTTEEEQPTVLNKDINANNFDCLVEEFGNNINKIDVRDFEMPQPMMKILEALDQLEAGKALYVVHKRIPVFLLPELAQRGFQYRIKEIVDGEVLLLIFRTKQNS
jgi:uncharacterized protein (DUF2249 family)